MIQGRGGGAGVVVIGETGLKGRRRGDPGADRGGGRGGGGLAGSVVIGGTGLGSRRRGNLGVGLGGSGGAVGKMRLGG